MTRLLIIGYVWPEPRSSAAGARMMQLIELFLGQGWCVTFASPAALGEHREDLARLGVREDCIELNSSSFDDYVRSLQPDIVLFDRFMMEEQFGWRVEQQCPDALRILNTEDLHSLREARHLAMKRQLKSAPEVADFSELFQATRQQLFEWMSPLELAQREIAAILRCDLSIIISEFEVDLLTEQFGVLPELLHQCPLMLSAAPGVWPGYEARQHFIHIGNFRHAPNWDAVLWLKQSLWPQIRQMLPRAELHIYGAYPPPKATDLHNASQGFLVKGWARDAMEVMTQARVCLAPLRFGAGIKGKLADALWCGTPSVTTPIGSEAMSGEFPWPGTVADNEVALAKAAVDLHENAELWGHAQARARALLPLYDRSICGHLLMERINERRAGLEAARRRNFLGAMLRHHHHKSTRYMSKWIEAKNRLQQTPLVQGPK